MESTATNNNHSFRYDNTKLYITGLKELGTYDDKEIVLKLVDNRLVIKGENLKIDDLNVKNGVISIVGILHSFVYSKTLTTKSVINKIFK